MQKFMMVAAALAVGTLSAQDVTDFDRDGLPDLWESQFGLATNSAVGDNGPYGDPDCDGLSNYAEFMAGYWEIGGNVYSNCAHVVPGLSPTNACSVATGVLDAYVRPSGTNDCLRLLHTDGDFCDDAWELTHPLASVDSYDDIATRHTGTCGDAFAGQTYPRHQACDAGRGSFTGNARVGLPACFTCGCIRTTRWRVLPVYSPNSQSRGLAIRDTGPG